MAEENFDITTITAFTILLYSKCLRFLYEEKLKHIRKLDRPLLFRKKFVFHNIKNKQKICDSYVNNGGEKYSN